MDCLHFYICPSTFQIFLLHCLFLHWNGCCAFGSIRKKYFSNSDHQEESKLPDYFPALISYL